MGLFRRRPAKGQHETPPAAPADSPAAPADSPAAPADSPAAPADSPASAPTNTASAPTNNPVINPANHQANDPSNDQANDPSNDQANNHPAYRIFSEAVPVTEIDAFTNIRADFTHVRGFSELGHLILSNAQTSDYGILHPLKNAYKNYGPFADLDVFQAQVLDDDGFATAVLRPAHVARIRALHGPLSGMDVYIPTPYPFLGGDEAPEHYDTGSLLVFLSIVDGMLNPPGDA